MATPTYSEVINQVNTFIVTNGNNEITADVLNPVLKFITDFANNHMGDLSSLTTSETDNLVSAINSLKEDLDNSSNNAVKLYTGVENPNTVSPASFNYADFYMQIDFLTSEPITLWQWNGFEWKDSSSVPATESDNVNNNSSVPGITVTDALDTINSKIPTTYSKIVYVNSTTPATATIFDIENPPVTNDDLLKNDVANLYIGTDASNWVYNSGTSTYVTKTISSATSNFYLSGTATDAGNSKSANISRTGTIEGKSFIKTGATVDQVLVGDGSVRTLSDVQNGVVQSLQPYRINLSNFNNEKSLDLNTRRNLIVNSETYTTANNFFTANSATIDNNDTMYFQGIKMVKLKDANFFSNLNIRQTNLVAGKRYMFSYYVKSNVGEDFIFDDIGDSNQSGHRRRFIDSSVRRVYWIGQAVSNTFLDKFLVPTTAMGSGTGSYATIGVSKTFTASAANPYGNMYIGGVQIEEIPDTYVDGVVWMGDSTIAGDAGLNNGYQNTAIPSLFSDIMNCSSFNKGIAGERLDQIDARWATSVTPLKNNSKYVIIQGGLNDIGQGTRTLADMQASINSMNAKALADGLIPIYLTCSPNDNFDATQETLRDNFNYWLLTTFVKVIDINNAIEFNSKLIQGFPRYVTDGIHYGLTLRKAVAGFIAKSPFFEFLKPTDYQSTTATYTGKDIVAKNVSAEKITITLVPTTSAGGYDVLTRNTTTGVEEKVPSTTFAPNILTGYVSSPGTVVATDTPLQAIQKLNGNMTISGTYTPVCSSPSNFGGGVVNRDAVWTRTGNIVNVKFDFVAGVTTAGVDSNISISLPFTVATGDQQYIGSGSASVSPYANCYIQANSGATTCQLFSTPTVTTSARYVCNITYVCAS